MSDKSVVEVVEHVLDDLAVPVGRMRDVVMQLADLADAPDADGHKVVASSALGVAIKHLRVLYEARSPLQEQVDILRGERLIRELRERGEIDD